MRRFRHPFTLVELLCVVIVIALLAAMSVKITQIAYQRADKTKTKTVLEIFRNANEQYKLKNGYYLPTSLSSVCNTNFVTPAENSSKNGYYRVKIVNSEFSDFFGDAYETLKSMPTKNGNDDYIRDAWGNEIRYCCPGKYNTGSYDLYSIGKDGETLICDPDNTSSFNKLKKSGFGDDITYFKDPSIK